MSFHNVVVPPPKSPLEDLFDFLEEPQLLRFISFPPCRPKKPSCLRRPVGLPSPLYERTHRETDAQEVYLTLQLLGNNGKPLIPETTVPRIQCVPFSATAALLPWPSPLLGVRVSIASGCLSSSVREQSA